MLLACVCRVAPLHLFASQDNAIDATVPQGARVQDGATVLATAVAGRSQAFLPVRLCGRGPDERRRPASHTA